MDISRRSGVLGLTTVVGAVVGQSIIPISPAEPGEDVGDQKII